MQINDLRLLGIPRWRPKITRVYPHHDSHWRFPRPVGKGMLAEAVIVARVRPRTSKGITDLLLPQTSFR